jgi:hypothetical protein
MATEAAWLERKDPRVEKEQKQKKIPAEKKKRKRSLTHTGLLMGGM